MAVFGKKRVVSFTTNGVKTIVDGTACAHGTLTAEGTGVIGVGYNSPNDNFIAYADNVLTGEGKVVDHGVGETLQVTISGISGTVDISYTPGC